MFVQCYMEKNIRGNILRKDAEYSCYIQSLFDIHKTNSTMCDSAGLKIMSKE